MLAATSHQPRGSDFYLIASAVSFTGAVRVSTAANTLFVIPAVALLLLAVLRRSSAICDNPVRGHRLRVVLWIAVTVVASTAILEVRLVGMYPGRETLWFWFSSVWIAIVAAAWMIGRRRPDRLSAIAWSVLLITVAEISFVMFLHETPDIDVYHLHDAAAARLADGASPYRDLNISDSSPFAEPGSKVGGYPYPPTTLAWFALGSWLGDPRLASASAWLLTLIIVAVPILKNDRNRFLGTGLLLLLATQPGWIFVVDKSWTEPLTLLLVVGGLFTWCRMPFTSGLLLGLAIVSKQYMIVMLPATLMTIDGNRRTRLAGIATGTLALSLPLAVADASGLWKAAVVDILALPPRPDASNLVGLAIRPDFSWLPPAWVALLVPTFLAIWIVRNVHGITGLALAYASGLSVFFLLASQAFANYWLLSQGLTVLAVGLSHGKTPPSDNPGKPGS